MSRTQATINQSLAGPADAADNAADTPRGAGVAEAAPAPPSSSADPSAPSDTPRANVDLERILKLPITVSVTLAERDLEVASILAITAGTIIEFDARFDASLTLAAAGQPIGLGKAVKVGENFGLRLTQIDNIRDRIQVLGR